MSCRTARAPLVVGGLFGSSAARALLAPLGRFSFPVLSWEKT